MVRLFAVLVLAGASAQAESLLETFGSGANQFQIEFVTIGNPGNVADSGTNAFSLAPYSAGAVTYTYNIGKYEISRDQISKANAAANLGLSLWDMTINPLYGGFGMSGEANGGGRPASGISWYGAAKFVNYLNTSKGYQSAYKFNGSTFETWNSEDAGFQVSNPYRNKNAYYFLPSFDEWYKAAYGSPDGTWFDYSTGSNTAPAGISGGNLLNTAVYGQGYSKGAADIDNAGGLSAWGTMAQGGNMGEFTESARDGSNNMANETRLSAGGLWYGGSNGIAANGFGGLDPSTNDGAYGFRVASVPEPSSLSLLLASGAVLMAGRRRKS